MSRASDVPVVDCCWPLAVAVAGSCVLATPRLVSRCSGNILFTCILQPVLFYLSAHNNISGQVKAADAVRVLGHGVLYNIIEDFMARRPLYTGSRT